MEAKKKLNLIVIRNSLSQGSCKTLRFVDSLHLQILGMEVCIRNQSGQKLSLCKFRRMTQTSEKRQSRHKIHQQLNTRNPHVRDLCCSSLIWRISSQYGLQTSNKILMKMMMVFLKWKVLSLRLRLFKDFILALMRVMQNTAFSRG